MICDFPDRLKPNAKQLEEIGNKVASLCKCSCGAEVVWMPASDNGDYYEILVCTKCGREEYI